MKTDLEFFDTEAKPITRPCPCCHVPQVVKPAIGFAICQACAQIHGEFSVAERQWLVGGKTVAEVLDLRIRGEAVQDGRLHIPEAFRHAVADERRLDWVYAGKLSLLLCGGVGVGKTYQGCGVMKAILRQHRSEIDQAYLVPCISLGRIQGEEIQRYATARAVLLDDLGARLQQASLATTLEILDARMSTGRRTVCTTNLMPAALSELDQRLSSRLAAGEIHVMGGVDRRLA